MKLRDVLYLPKSTRHALYLIIFLIAGAFIAIHILGSGGLTAEEENDSIARTRGRHAKDGSKQQYYYVEEKKYELFPFDPNTADSTQLLRLGLQPWQVRNIYKYRASGGIYREKEDFAQLYGLTVKQYRALEPFIHISEDYRPAAEVYHRKRPDFGNTSPSSEQQYERDTSKYPVKLKEGESVVLNVADTTQLKKIPGIGTYFAKAIVRYGQKLGGYYSKEQLLEISGFPGECLEYIKVDPTRIRKININRLTLDQLKRHPYINFYQARGIVDYRRLKGDIKSLDDLRLLKEFPPEAIKRLEPYVEY